MPWAGYAGPVANVELPGWVLARLLAPEARVAARQSWLEARKIGGRLDLEWAFPVNAVRGAVRADPVLSPFYEPLSTWEEVLRAVVIRELLERADVAPDLNVHIGLGLELFDGAYRAPGGRLIVAAPGEPFRGRHWTWAAALHDERTLAFMNTWGSGWGDGGVGYISREYFEQHVDSCLIQRPAFTGSSPAMLKALTANHWRAGRPREFDPREWAKSWVEPNPRLMGHVEVRGQRYERFRRTVWSAAARAPGVHIFDVVDNRAFVARFHLVEPDHTGTAILQELWVDPERRRQGFGQALDEQAARLARNLGAQRIVVPLFEADATGQNRSAAAGFARARGYGWDWLKGRRPNIEGTAEKALSRG